jgi:hypothetical protein
VRYWWVNQNQTFRQETAGGYLWSPKRRRNETRNPYYEFMREIAPGDPILSFEGTFIRKAGIAQSYCYECPKPAEFGAAGRNWDIIGWKVDVRYLDLPNQIRPAEHMDVLGPRLPARYSPLRANGHGQQNIYLTPVPGDLMAVLADLIGAPLRALMRAELQMDVIGRYGDGLLEWESHLTRQIEFDPGLGDTEREQLILARLGQGRFKENVRLVESECRITKVQRLEHLRASHIRPWRDSDHEQRLDGENGLLLTPSIDHLFDRGFISFEDNGRLLASPVADPQSLARMGIPLDAAVNVGPFSEGQRRHLDFHRNDVFLEARTR